MKQKFPPLKNLLAIILLWPIIAFALRLLVLYGMSSDFWRFPLCDKGEVMISLCTYGFLFFFIWFKGIILFYGLGVALYLSYAKIFSKPVHDLVIFFIGPIAILFAYWLILVGPIQTPVWLVEFFYK